MEGTEEGAVEAVDLEGTEEEGEGALGEVLAIARDHGPHPAHLYHPHLPLMVPTTITAARPGTGTDTGARVG